MSIASISSADTSSMESLKLTGFTNFPFGMNWKELSASLFSISTPYLRLPFLK
jgi:hypothetical protein